jgi:hypothetical protein
MEIDKENGNTLWMDAIKLEMQNVRIAFEDFDGDPNTLVGYTQITGQCTLCLTSKLVRISGERQDSARMATRRARRHQ